MPDSSPRDSSRSIQRIRVTQRRMARYPLLWRAPPELPMCGLLAGPDCRRQGEAPIRRAVPVPHGNDRFRTCRGPFGFRTGQYSPASISPASRKVPKRRKRKSGVFGDRNRAVNSRSDRRRPLARREGRRCAERAGLLAGHLASRYIRSSVSNRLERPGETRPFAIVLYHSDGPSSLLVGSL